MTGDELNDVVDEVFAYCLEGLQPWIKLHRLSSPLTGCHLRLLFSGYNTVYKCSKGIIMYNNVTLRFKPADSVAHESTKTACSLNVPVVWLSFKMNASNFNSQHSASFKFKIVLFQIIIKKQKIFIGFFIALQ